MTHEHRLNATQNVIVDVHARLADGRSPTDVVQLAQERGVTLSIVEHGRHGRLAVSDKAVILPIEKRDYRMANREIAESVTRAFAPKPRHTLHPDLIWLMSRDTIHSITESSATLPQHPTTACIVQDLCITCRH